MAWIATVIGIVLLVALFAFQVLDATEEDGSTTKLPDRWWHRGPWT